MTVPARETITFAVWGPIRREDLPGLCDRVCALLAEAGPGGAVCDVRGVRPDAVTVDALARLQLGASRHGCRVRLRNASPELLELVGFMGLDDVVADEGEAMPRGEAAARRAGRASPSRGRTSAP